MNWGSIKLWHVVVIWLIAVPLVAYFISDARQPSLQLTAEDIARAAGATDTPEGDDWQPHRLATSSVTTYKARGYLINVVMDYEAALYDAAGHLTITKDGEEVFTTVGDFDVPSPFVRFWPISNKKRDTKIDDSDPGHRDLNKDVYDITGNGIPELVFEGFTGGAHCCEMNYIIELSNPLKILWRQFSGDGSATLVDLNNDGIMEIEVMDDVLDYWNTSHAASPFPTVTLSLQKSAYHADPKYMRRPAPSDADLKRTAKLMTAEYWSGQYCAPDDEVCMPPWGYVVDLIYTGNMETAKKFIDMAWVENETFKSKDDFIAEFVEALKAGKYYEDLAPFLNLSALRSL